MFLLKTKRVPDRHLWAMSSRVLGSVRENCGSSVGVGMGGLGSSNLLSAMKLREGDRKQVALSILEEEPEANIEEQYYHSNV